MTNLGKALRAIGGNSAIKVNNLSGSHMALHVAEVVGCELRHKYPALLHFYAVAVARKSRHRKVSTVQMITVHVGDATGGRYFDTHVKEAAALTLLRIKFAVRLQKLGILKPKVYEEMCAHLVFYMEQPTPVFWLYIEVFRNLSKFNLENYKEQIAPLEIRGPEDHVLAGEQIAKMYDSRNGLKLTPRKEARSNDRIRLAGLMFDAAPM